MTKRADYAKLNRPAIDALGSVGKCFSSITPKLRALVELRVSQINGCGYCVDMHTTQARSHGETQQRLDLVAAWWECDFFDPAEVAALRWAEALTDISHTHAPDALYDALVPHYSEQQIVDLTLCISVMNAWNRIAVAHHQHPRKRPAVSVHAAGFALLTARYVRCRAIIVGVTFSHRGRCLAGLAATRALPS